MVAPQLRVLLAAAPGQGRLDGPTVGRGRAEHPLCGDLVEVDLTAVRGRIDALAWRATGCPATLAVAAVAATVLPTCPLADAAATLRAGLAVRGDLHAAERHAETMFCRALQQALASLDEGT